MLVGRDAGTCTRAESLLMSDPWNHPRGACTGTLEAPPCALLSTPHGDQVSGSLTSMRACISPGLPSKGLRLTTCVLPNWFSLLVRATQDALAPSWWLVSGIRRASLLGFLEVHSPGSCWVVSFSLDFFLQFYHSYSFNIPLQCCYSVSVMCWGIDKPVGSLSPRGSLGYTSPLI